MTREEFIKNLIKENGLTIKDYAEKIGMAYSTLLTMLNNEKLGVASIDNVIKICKGLNITVEDLQKAQFNNYIPTNHLILSEHEKSIILNYRQKIDLQKAVDILLFSDL